MTYFDLSDTTVSTWLKLAMCFRTSLNWHPSDDFMQLDLHKYILHWLRYCDKTIQIFENSHSDSSCQRSWD